MTNSPCYKCEDRTEGCHSTCKAYQDWLVVHEKERSARWLYFASTRDADAHTKHTIEINCKRAQTKRRVGQR